MRSSFGSTVIAVIMLVGVNFATDLRKSSHYQPPRTEAKQERGTKQQVTGMISGHLRFADIGTPMSDTEIILFDHLGIALEQRTKTDREGRYAFKEIVPSVYTVEALKRGYVGSSGSEGERTFRLKEGQVIENVNLELRSGGSISGRVLDADGNSIPNATVCVVQYNGIEASWGRTPSMAQTDSHGIYHLKGLETGRYYVCTTLDAHSPWQGFAPIYAPGTTKLEKAHSVWVAAGKQVQNVNISPGNVRWFSVTGVVLDSQGQPAVLQGDGIRSMPPPGKVVVLDTIHNSPGGAFTTKLPQGNHTLAVTTSNGEFGRISVTVADRDVSGVVIRTSPGATIKGRLEIEGTPPPEQSSIVIGTYATESADGLAPTDEFAHVGSDGAFTISKLFGPRRFWVYVPITGWALDGVWVDGRNVIDMSISFDNRNTPSAVRLVMTNKTTHLRCAAIDKKGNPTLAEALIYSPDPARWYIQSRFERSSILVDDGSIQFDGLPPGDYLAVAIPVRHQIYGAEDIEPHEYLRRFAKPFTLKAGETKDITLRLVIPPQR